MKCDKCGYSDNGSGDWAHACGPVAIQRQPVANERIRQLAEQAGLVKILEEHAHEYGNGMFENTPYPELEKFAELIVRECCIALNPMLRDMISRGQGVDLIKLHFGMNPKEITTAMLDTAIEQCKQELAKTKSGEE
jgi:hypothetical protein